MMRSLLYVPATSERFLAKAAERGADVLIVDLEDAIPESRKDAARESLAEAVRLCRRGPSRVFVRINGSTERERLDVEAACRAGADGVFVPKIRDAAHVLDIERQIEVNERRRTDRPAMRLILAIETASALFEARAIAGACARTVGLNCGSEDISTALGAQPSPETLYLPKLLVHIAAKAAGVLSIGLLRSVADYRDRDAIAASASEARRYGFDGATCVHPSVVPDLNAAFAPDAAQIRWARALVAAAKSQQATGQGVFVFEGKMVDRPVFRRAETLLAALSEI